MTKFFVDNNAINENKIYISGQDYNHIKNVLRYTLGDKILVSDGVNKEYEVEIIKFHENFVETNIIQDINDIKEPNVNVSLFQAIPKGDKMEIIIQKAVEIGAKRIIPIITNRVIVRIDSKNLVKKTERWQKVSEHAAKQSGRNVIPRVYQPLNFNESINKLKNYDCVIILHEKEKNKFLKDILNNLNNKPKNIAVFIGPEGGFADEEIKMVNQYNVISLGSRILRTDTAGLVTLAIIMYEMGEMN